MENINNKWNGLKVELDLSKSIIGVSNIESLQGERFMSGFVKAIIPPEGYIFKDENGNKILTSKIILEKKKKEYPKTYKECFNICFGNKHHIIQVVGFDGLGDNKELFESFIKLKVCRDAYWKIAGEEMGLGNPWEPDWNIKGYYAIARSYGNVVKTSNYNCDLTFVFPTEEMRDFFYKAFKEDIEYCKELL